MRQISKWAVAAAIAAGLMSTGCKKADPKPADPPKTAAPADKPADPAAPADKPADPAAPADKPADPTAPADKPADPAAPADKPADPAAPADKPANPAAPADKPADPAAPAAAVDCEKAIDHMLELITKEATIPEDKKAEALARAKSPEGRAQALAGCQKAPPAITSCMLAASDLQGAMRCQMEAMKPPTDGPGAEPAVPSPDEGECGKATDHMIALLEKDTTIPAEAKTAMLGMVKTVDGRKQAIESCRKEPTATIQCMMAATDFKTATECSRPGLAPDGAAPAPSGGAPAPAPEGGAPAPAGAAPAPEGAAPAPAP